MGRLRRPLVPDGPLREFYDRLHALHEAAGEPSMRQLQRNTRSDRRPNGINPTTIHDAFASARLARWEVVREIVRHLGGDVDEFDGLWRRARDAHLHGAGPAVPPGGSAAASPVPRELPADVFAFTGRRDHLKALGEMLSGDGRAVVISAITGTGGVGKTALAVHWGHRVRDRFPDGQLYLDLHGYAPGVPVRPAEALGRFLRALGVPGEQVPADVEAASARYRSLLADRRVLVVLDNAAGAEQVRPLLPASPTCLVLVTSRNRLSGLVARDGARRLGLDVLAADEAEALLATMLGAERLAAEPKAAAELARRCAYLPLALRVAAANLSNHPQRRLGEYVATLAADGGLAALEVDGDEPAGVRRCFDLSYRALPDAARRLFRLLGAAPGADISAAAAAVLAGEPPARGAAALDLLAAAHVVDQRAPGRYACHDLLRQYAADLHRAEDAGEAGRAALDRLVTWYLHRADAAARLLYPHRMRLPVPPPEDPVAVGFANRAAALAWLDAERSNLVAAVGHAADHGLRPVAWLLADTLRSYFWAGMHTVDWPRAAHAGLRAAEAAGDLHGQAAALLSLSDLHHRQRRYLEAIDHNRRALAIAERAGWLPGQATALGNLGTVHRDLGRAREAAEFYARALALFRACGARNGEIVTLSHLGRAYFYLGRLPEAIESSSQALQLYREIGSHQGVAATLDDLGEILRACGRPDEALAHLTRALDIEHEIGDRGSEACTLRNLAAVQLDRGRPGEARELARAALRLATELGDGRIEADAHNTMGAINGHLGHHPDAARHHQRALDLAHRGGDRYPEVEALIGLAAAHHRLGDHAGARAHAQSALAAARQTGYRLLEERAAALHRSIELQPT